MQRTTSPPFRWAGLYLLALILLVLPASAVTLQQVISRENSAFSLTNTIMNVGKDGKVYIANPSGGTSFVMRINTDGTQKGGGVLPVESLNGVAANANGIIATANAHFARSVNLYTPSFATIASVGGFLGSDQVGWDGPADVEVGASGDFYGLDQHNNRILRINPSGQITATYTFPPQSDAIDGFRVCEATQRFIIYVRYSTLVSVGFDGVQKWSGNFGTSGYDLDASGNLYTLGGYTNTIYKYDVNGAQIGTITLANALSTNTGAFRVTNTGQIILRYGVNTELFRVYDAGTGALVRTVAPAIDTLTATYSSQTWTAGATMPFTITFSSPLSPAPTPTWHVWGRPCDTAVSIGSNGQVSSAYQDFGYVSGNQTITVPSGCAGLYDIKVTPEQAGWQRGIVSEYRVNDVVEIRAPSTSGSISVFTTVTGLPITGTVAVTNGSTGVTGTGTTFTALTAGSFISVNGVTRQIASITDATHLTVASAFSLTASGATLYQIPSFNRLHFNPGEQISFMASIRASSGWPSSVTVNLYDANNTVVASGTASGLPAANNTVALYIPAAITAGLAPGSYTLKATTAGFTCVPQPIILGAGLQKSPFRIMLYGDYGTNYINGNLTQERDLVANHAVELQKVGINTIIDRHGANVNIFPFMNWPGGQSTDGQDLINSVQSRLSGDATATDPAKANPEVPLGQTLAAYSAGNTESMAILMGMDAPVPLGLGVAFDSRPLGDPNTPGTFEGDLTRVTNFLLPYATFRGWSWGNEWWNQGGDGAQDPTEETNYQNALTTAKNTGVWNSVIDTVANRRLNRGTDAWSTLASVPIMQNNPQLVRATAGEFRNIDCWPPFCFSTVDETDLNAQWEQYKVPYDTIFGVEYYQRPGKKGWLHPEIWNDTGTGEQVFANLFMGIMRQTYGVGNSTSAGGNTIFGGWNLPEDTRSAYNGLTSIYRAMNTGLLTPFGPWITTLNKNDHVAIVVSERQAKIDDWAQQGNRHQERLMEAYLAALHCHYPATLVFTTDMTTTSLNGYQAVLLVGQTVQLDPGLQTTLTNAHTAGAAIFYDGTCRDVDNVFSTFGATALGISFNHFESLPTLAGNDYTYLSYLNAVRGDETALSTALAAVTQPATVGIDEVFVSESVADQGRYVYVVNNSTATGIDPGNEWLVTNFCATRVPVQTTITLPNITGKTVYDVFAKASLGTPSGGNVTADLRSLPMRIYAILPSAIDHVKLTGPNTAVTCGQPFNWIVKVCNASDAAIAASIPVHVQLLASDGTTVLRETYTAATASGATGSFVLPANLSGAPILKATELFTGLSSSQTISYTTIAPQTLLAQGATPPALGTPVAATLATNGTTPDATAPVAQNAFGPHVRDIAISADGTQVLCSTFNWDHNLYAVNLGTGAVNWRQRAGMYFTFAPQAAGTGFAVQGFNFGTAEGYGMYLVGSTGTLTRRFSSYGIARRDLGWLLSDPVESDAQNNFTAAPDGSWVATAGNLGLAVWNASGTLLWKQDWPDRHLGRVLALSNTALFVCEGFKLTSYNATTGAQNWQVQLATTPGIVSKAVVSGDGSTIALLTTNLGGTVYALNSSTGAVTATFPTGGQDIGITSTGSLVAIASANQLKLYSKANGLQWIFGGDTYVRFPRFSADNTKLVCTSDLGTVTVFDTSGSKLFERDLGALCAPGWLANGDLVLASWQGAVYRLTAGTYAQQWCTLLTPTATDMRTHLMDADSAPVTRITTWSNALPTPYPITPNLLTPATSYTTYVDNGNQWAYFQPTNLGAPYSSEDASALLDGSATAPSTPWLLWENVFSESVSGPQTDLTHIQLDSWNTLMNITGITLWEDPNNPGSWLRDATLDYWDVPTQTWKTGPVLLSDQATHSHVIDPPITSPRVRVTLSPTCMSNIRLGEIVLNGSLQGCSHPDVVAGNNTCVLFDENTFPLNGRMVGSYTFQYSDAYSGALCFATTGPGVIYPNWGWSGPFHYWIQDWNMKIVQTPQNANEYRYLQFAWKAVDATVTGITLEIGDITGGSTNSLASIYCGTWCGLTMWPYPSTLQYQTSTTVPTTWTPVTIDLWALSQAVGGLNIRSMNLCTVGGSGKVEFDAIKLLKNNSGDLAPTCSLTTDYATYTAPATVVMTATASDADGTVSKVEFYNGYTLLGTDSTSPYAYTWSNVGGGVYSLTARAYDNLGVQTNSAAVQITVNGAQCATPTFTPAAGTYSAAQNVTISTGTTGATIRYTTDGTTPTETIGTVGTTVTINSTCTLKAIAYKAGMSDSAVASGVYTINPIPTTGLRLWLKGDAITGLTDGAAVATWSDSSGVGSNATQTTPAYQPTYVASGLNGKPAVHFNNANTQFMNIASAFNGNVSTITEIAVLKGSYPNRALFQTMPGQGDNLVYDPWSDTISHACDWTATANIDTSKFPTGGLLTVICERDGGNHLMLSTYSNGPRFDGPRYGDTGTIWVQSSYLGSDNREAYCTGDVSELLIYDHALTTADKQAVEAYLATKYGLTVTVDAPPAVSITAPTDGSVFAAPANITLTASASDSDGTITKVEFYSGNTLLGTDSTSPYSYAWNSVAAGTYTVIAKAYDNGGAVTLSVPITLTVATPVATPTFSLAPGTYYSIQTVTISTTTDGATIRYTTDGTTPTETVGTVYGTPVILNASCTLKAIAYTAGYADSAVASGTYTFSDLLNVTNWSWVPTVYPPTYPVPPANSLPMGWTLDCHPVAGNQKPANIQYETASNGVTYLTVDHAGTNATDGLIFTFPVQLSGDFTVEFDAPNNDMSTNFLDLRDGSGNTVIAISAYANYGARYITVGSNTWYVSGVPLYYGPFLNTPYLNDVVPYFTWGHFKLVRTGTTYTLIATALNNPGGTPGATASWSVNAGSAPAATSIRFNNPSGWQWSSWANVRVAMNLQPVADPDNYLTNKNTTLVVSAPGVLGNDGDPLSNPLTATKASDPAHGTVTVNSNGSFTYVPTTGYSGTDSFTYTSSNGLGWNAVATVNLIVNNPPAVSLTAPTPGQVFTAPATIAITATASDTDGTISKVEFYSGATLLGTSSTSPYSYTWSNVTAGSYTLTAMAYDNQNATTTSSGVNVISDTPPTVSLTAPTPGQVFTAPASIAITATASDTDGTISKVEFYNGANLLGTSSTSPYSFTWTNVAAGSYTLTAKAYDNYNLTTTSSGVNVISDAPPTVSLTAPAANTNYIAPASVAMTATASDSDGTISKVEFYQGSNLVGTASTSPYNYTWTSVTMGNYALTAKAYDNNNVATTSSAVNIIVWGTSDIGSVGVAGSASYSGGTFTVSGAGAGVTSTADAFRYVYRQFSGNTTIVARVASATSPSTATRAGVMMRQNLNANSIEASAMYKPTSTYYVYFLRRTSAGGSTSSTTSSTAAAPPYWVKVVRSSNTLSAFMSANGSSWTAVGSGTTVTMSDPIYVGLAVTSGSTSAAKTVTFDNVSVTQP